MSREEYKELDILLAEGKAKELLEKSKEAIFLNHDSGWAYYYRAMAYCLGKDFEKAYDMIQIALEKLPQEAQLHAAKAEILIQLNLVAEAQYQYKKAIELDAANPISWFFYGKYLLKYKKKKNAALFCMQKAVDLQPDHLDMAMELAKTYIEEGYIVEAKKLCRQILIQDEEHQAANYCYGRLLIQDGMPGTALEYVSRAFLRNWNNRDYERDFFSAYRVFHPQKAVFWQVTLWMNRWFVKVIAALGLVITLMNIKEFTSMAVLFAFILVYSFTVPTYFYKKFEQEYEVIHE